MANEFFKELVIAYAIVEKNGEHLKYIYTQPIITGNTAEGGMQALEDIDVKDTERIISVIPAPFPTYCIQAVDDKTGEIFILGYEHPTLEPNDWNVAYERAMKHKSYYGIREK